MPRTRCENRPRSMPWPLLLVLAVVALTPVALIGPTLISPRSAINTRICGKQLYLGRIYGTRVPPRVRPFTVRWGGFGLSFTTGTREGYLFYLGDGYVARNANGFVSLNPPLSLGPDGPMDLYPEP